MAKRTLSASANTIHWGHFDARLAPVVEIDPGDEIVVGSVSGAIADAPHAPGMTLRPELAEIQASHAPSPGPHILTGPIFVRGAAPGDALRIEILDVALADDWGFNWIKAAKGALPEDFPFDRLVHFAIDRERGVARAPWGHEIPAAPFFGVMGVAPPPTWGRISSLIPRAIGGNLDNKELTPGAKLYLPVFVPGALFSCGDGHAVQGDGEVCVTAIETALTGRFRFTLRPDQCFDYPRAETASHYMTMAMDPDLDQCVVRALRDMIKLIGEIRQLSREDAYTLCSLAADLRVTQTVNGSKGIHCMIAKSVIHG